MTLSISPTIVGILFTTHIAYKEKIRKIIDALNKGVFKKETINFIQFSLPLIYIIQLYLITVQQKHLNFHASPSTLLHTIKKLVGRLYLAISSLYFLALIFILM